MELESTPPISGLLALAWSSKTLVSGSGCALTLHFSKKASRGFGQQTAGRRLGLLFSPPLLFDAARRIQIRVGLAQPNGGNTYDVGCLVLFNEFRGRVARLYPHWFAPGAVGPLAPNYSRFVASGSLTKKAVGLGN